MGHSHVAVGNVTHRNEWVGCHLQAVQEDTQKDALRQYILFLLETLQQLPSVPQFRHLTVTQRVTPLQGASSQVGLVWCICMPHQTQQCKNSTKTRDPALFCCQQDNTWI